MRQIIFGAIIAAYRQNYIYDKNLIYQPDFIDICYS